MSPIDKLVNYIKTRHATNQSFENLVTSLRDEERAIEEQAYGKGYEDGYNEALEANDNPAEYS